jgi:hypothetical protein
MAKCDVWSAARTTLPDVNEPLHDEVLDGVPVLPDEPSGVSMSDVSMFPASESRSLPVVLSRPVQTAAAAAGGFVAGAALLGLVHRRHSRRVALSSGRSPRRLGRAGKRSKSAGELSIVGSRSLLVDVHLLGSPLRSR